MVEYIIVSFATIGPWFNDLMPSGDQLLGYWPYLLVAVLGIFGIFLLINRR